MALEPLHADLVGQLQAAFPFGAGELPVHLFLGDRRSAAHEAVDQLEELHRENDHDRADRGNDGVSHEAPDLVQHGCRLLFFLRQ